jgi:hypothetical protein
MWRKKKYLIKANQLVKLRMNWDLSIRSILLVYLNNGLANPPTNTDHSIDQGNDSL